jgi:hypothetical protein
MPGFLELSGAPAAVSNSPVLADVKAPRGARPLPASAWTSARRRTLTGTASVGTKRVRAEKAFLLEWDAARPKRRPRYLGADKIHRGKAQKFYTVLSDVVHGEVIGLAKDRSEDSLAALLTTSLVSDSARSQRGRN